jgi:cholesterol transport system auxiliary component
MAATCVAVLVGALTSGCTGLTSASAERRYYAIQVPSPLAAKPAESAPILLVRRFEISAPYERSEFVYRTGDSTYECDFYNAFSASPADQVTGQTQQFLAATGLFSRVLGAQALPDAAGTPQAQYVLDGNVVSLYGDYRDGAAPKAVLELGVFLLRMEGNAPRIVAQDGYRMEVPLAESGPGALVKGWDEALGRALADLVQELRKLNLGGHP